MEVRINSILPTFFEESRSQTSEVWGKEIVVEQGELVKIVAPSGSGKSSLINFMYGVRKDFNGKISYNKASVKDFSLEKLSKYRKDHISIVFQDLRLFPDQTVQQNLEIKRQLNPFHPPAKITEMAQRLGIGHRLQLKAGMCSYGEQQRTAIIRSLLQPFEVLLLDEPFSHLDTDNSQKAMELILEEAKARKATVIFADLERIDYFPNTRLLHL